MASVPPGTSSWLIRVECGRGVQTGMTSSEGYSWLLLQSCRNVVRRPRLSGEDGHRPQLAWDKLIYVLKKVFAMTP
jgi:hypothetical protein